MARPAAFSPLLPQAAKCLANALRLSRQARRDPGVKARQGFHLVPKTQQESDLWKDPEMPPGARPHSWGAPRTQML